jgi:hypothetical protein
VSDGLHQSVSARRGWGWVVAGGTAAALLATYPDLGPTLAGWLWWAVAAGAGLVWRAAWWVPWVTALVVVGAAGGAGFYVWRRRRM